MIAKILSGKIAQIMKLNGRIRRMVMMIESKRFFKSYGINLHLYFKTGSVDKKIIRSGG